MSTEKQAEVVEQTDLLNSFAWESEDSFFGIKEEPVEKQQETVIKKVKTPEKPKEEEKIPEVVKPDEDVIEDEETELFPDLKDDDKKPDDEKPKGDEVNEDNEVFVELSKALKEREIFQHIELPEDGEITEEKFFELMIEEVEGRLDEERKDFVANLKSDEGAAFVDYIMAGGKANKFLEFYAASGSILDVDIEKENGQDAIIRHYFKTIEQLDDDDIEDKLDWMKESGKKKKYAEKYHEKFKADDKAAKDKFLQDEVDRQTAKEEAKKEFITNLKATLDKVESIKGIVFTKQDKIANLDYIIKPAVKFNSNQYLTQFQVDLNDLVKKGGEDLLLFAKLLRSKFDFSELAIKKETEAVKKVKSSLASKKSILSSVNNSKGKSLSEYF